MKAWFSKTAEKSPELEALEDMERAILRIENMAESNEKVEEDEMESVGKYTVTERERDEKLPLREREEREREKVIEREERESAISRIENMAESNEKVEKEEM